MHDVINRAAEEAADQTHHGVPSPKSVLAPFDASALAPKLPFLQGPLVGSQGIASWLGCPLYEKPCEAPSEAMPCERQSWRRRLVSTVRPCEPGWY